MVLTRAHTEIYCGAKFFEVTDRVSNVSLASYSCLVRLTLLKVAMESAIASPFSQKM